MDRKTFLDYEEDESSKYWNQSVGSDVYPYELIRKIGKTQFELRPMDYWHGDDGWHFVSNPDRKTIRVSRRRDGAYRQVGEKYVYFVPSKEPRHYWDPHF